MTRFVRRSLVALFMQLMLVVPAGLLAADDAAQLIEQAEQLARSKQIAAALEKIDAAVAEMDHTQAAGERISWQGMNGLRFAAQLARDELLDYDKAFTYCDKLTELADSDYWRVPAQLERALTYRAMAEYAKAQRVYDEIAQADPRQRLAGMIPQAEMVYFELGDQARGQALIAEALSQQDINARERFNVIVKCARAALADGQRELALRWFARVDKLPVAKTHEKQQFLSQAWFEMGRIEESRGRLDAAKKLYRQAMQLPDGNMQLRVRARDALESIQYFE